jgi:predicted NBD/HSP70 family sugar kinase
LGSSVEAGIIINGNLHIGSTFSSGAIGHMTLNPNGVYCTCGNSGCLNTVIGSQALLSTTRDLLKENRTSLLMGMVDGNPSFLNLDHLLRATEAGDGLAVQIIADAGRSLGVIIASLVNFLNFQRVVIGGQLSAAGFALLTPIQEEVNIRALPTSLVTCQIEITTLGAASAAIGASSLLLQNLSH